MRLLKTTLPPIMPRAGQQGSLGMTCRQRMPSRLFQMSR